MEGTSKKKPTEYVEETLDQLKSRAKKLNEELKEKVHTESHKIRMMEAAMPAFLAMNMMKMAQTTPKLPAPEAPKETGEMSMLESKIQQKIDELLDEEQALSELYIKAAVAAREREEELREKIAQLETQAEKDRELIKLLRDRR